MDVDFNVAHSFVIFMNSLHSSIQFSSTVDLDETRLKMAKNLGADVTFKVTSRDGNEVAEKIVKEFGESSKTIECTGVESSIKSAIVVSS